MHLIAPYEPKVILTTWEGVTRVYASRLAALEALGFNYIRHNTGPRVSVEMGWNTLFTEFGEQLYPADFVALHKTLAAEIAVRRWQLRGEFWNGAGPVPGTGVGGRGRYYRHPQTMNERRMHAFRDTEAGEPRPRAARSLRNLPNSYDDITKSSYGHHTWKRHRKTQWKENKQKG